MGLGLLLSLIWLDCVVMDARIVALVNLATLKPKSPGRLLALADDSATFSVGDGLVFVTGIPSELPLVLSLETFEEKLMRDATMPLTEVVLGNEGLDDVGRSELETWCGRDGIRRSVIWLATTDNYELLGESRLAKALLPYVSELSSAEIPAPMIFMERVKEVLGQQERERIELRAFQDHLSKRKPMVTYGLMGCILVVFGLEYWWSGGTTDAYIPTLIRMGGNQGGLGLLDEPWRLLSAAFLHAGTQHLLFNGFVLWGLGRFLEPLLGHFLYLALFLVSALTGSVFSQLFSQSAVAVGASAGIWGYLAACAVLAFRPEGILPKSLVAGMRKTALFNLGLNIFVSFLPMVDMAGHLGGGIGGGLFTLSLVEFSRRKFYRGLWMGRATGVVLAVVAVVGMTVGWRQSQPWLLREAWTYVPSQVAESNVTILVPSHWSLSKRDLSEGELKLAEFGDLLDWGQVLVVHRLEPNQPGYWEPPFDQGKEIVLGSWPCRKVEAEKQKAVVIERFLCNGGGDRLYMEYGSFEQKGEDLTMLDLQRVMEGHGSF